MKILAPEAACWRAFALSCFTSSKVAPGLAKMQPIVLQVCPVWTCGGEGGTAGTAMNGATAVGYPGDGYSGRGGAVWAGRDQLTAQEIVPNAALLKAKLLGSGALAGLLPTNPVFRVMPGTTDVTAPGPAVRVAWSPLRARLMPNP
jgi:hypothetical protein